MNRRSFLQFAGSGFASGLLSQTIHASPPLPVSQTSARKASTVVQPLVMGVFPRRSPQQNFKSFKPLADYLSHAIQYPVILQTTRTYSEFWKNIQAQKYDIAHYNQYHYIVANHLYGHQVILKNHEYGSANIAATISVRKDSEYNQLSDLKNKSILFAGDKMAMQGYILPKWLLLNQGLGPEDYKEKFALNPPNAIISTYQKQADAAACADSVTRLDSVKNIIDVSKMKYLARTESLPHLPWAVNASVSVNLMRDIEHALSELRSDPTGHKVLDNAQLTALIPAVDSDYNKHRNIIREMYGKNFGIENLA